jgi:hypothetical protein
MSTVKLVPTDLLRDCSLAGTCRQSNWYQVIFYEIVVLLVHVDSQTGTKQSSKSLSACWYMSSVKLVPNNFLSICRLAGSCRHLNWYQTIFYEFVDLRVHVDSQIGTKQSSTSLKDGWYMSTANLVPNNLLRDCSLAGTCRKSNWYQLIFYEIVVLLVHVYSQTGTN